MITVEAYKNAQVHTITVKHKGLFGVKMVDVQNELSFKNVPDLVRREMCGIFENKDPTEEQKRKYMRSKREIRKTLKNDPCNCKYARSGIMEKIIENCRGVKNVMMA